MAERNISQNSIDSDKLKFDINARNSQEVTKEYGSIRPYNYNCQLDQYNVKLCGVVFDAIGQPDFFLKNDNLETKIDTLE
ncbi:unnamed protein product [Paramecium pentaurelia]|uniref:Uncharacterized protein n=1 Tax=Paramecium pentaurelia TaxID=43138 RepID=A0A8S1Y637_9CILI|nr:unnamed protein product [Paramecium pentaurelia]